MPERFIPAMGFWRKMPDLPEICADHQLVFVGPSPDSIRKMGGQVYR